MSSPTNENGTAPNLQPAAAPVAAKEKLVKIKVLYPIRRMINGVEHVHTPDQHIDPAKRRDVIVEVTEDEAKQFCDTKFDIGYTDTFGDRDKRDIKRTIVHRAERVK